MAANVLSGSNQGGPSANACIVAGETFVAHPPPFNRDSEGESIVVGDSSMGAVDSEEEKAGGVFHSSSIACNCAKFGGARLFLHGVILW